MIQRLEGLVSEQLLDVVEVGVRLDHLRRAGAPERVRRDADTSSGGTSLQPKLAAVVAIY